MNAPRSRRPILVLDFDGVCHSYTSGWQGPTIIPDPPVPGMFDFLLRASEHFELHILSSRSAHPGGIDAMKAWFARWAERQHHTLPQLGFPTQKPAAFLTMDDRSMTFLGIWPDPARLRRFKPWHAQ